VFKRFRATIAATRQRVACPEGMTMLYNPHHSHNRTALTTRPGFTLMELLVVVAILVVLAAVAVPSYFTYVDYSKRQTAKTSAYALAKAAETYHAATGEWPQNLQ